MVRKTSKKQVKLPKTTLEFDQAVKALAETKPISNKELVEWSKKRKQSEK
jgi:hypothetical protein